MGGTLGDRHQARPGQPAVGRRGGEEPPRRGRAAFLRRRRVIGPAAGAAGGAAPAQDWTAARPPSPHTPYPGYGLGGRVHGQRGRGLTPGACPALGRPHAGGERSAQRLDAQRVAVPRPQQLPAAHAAPRAGVCTGWTRPGVGREGVEGAGARRARGERGDSPFSEL